MTSLNLMCAPFQTRLNSGEEQPFSPATSTTVA